MKSSVFKYLLVFFTFLTSVSPATAGAELFQARGSIASFYSFVIEGCLASTRFLFVAREAAHFGSDGANKHEVLLYVEDHYDVCSMTPIMNVRGLKKLERSEYDLRNGYARVTSTVDVVDSVSGTSLPLTIDLTWIGDGDRLMNRVNYHYDTSDFKVVGRYLGFSEMATISGFIGNEPTSTPGNLEFVRYGEVTIYRKE